MACAAVMRRVTDAAKSRAGGLTAAEIWDAVGWWTLETIAEAIVDLLADRTLAKHTLDGEERFYVRGET